MSPANRRGFIKIAGAGAAAAGIGGISAAAAPTMLGGAATATPSDVALPAGAQGSLVAYIQDVQAGTVAVLAEGREVTVVDHQLVARLAHALHSGQPADV